MRGVFRHVRSHLVAGAHVRGMHEQHRRQSHLGPCAYDEQQNRGCEPLRHTDVSLAEANAQYK
jgi:hypothetical protein